MPAIHPPQECHRPRSIGETDIRTQLETSIRNLKPAVSLPVVFDTPDSLNCTNTEALTSMEVSYSDNMALYPVDRSFPSFDKVRAIVNIRITTDPVVSTRLSVLDPGHLDHAPDGVFSYLGGEKAELQSYSSAPPRGNDECAAASTLRVLYSLDPPVYSTACPPLALWVANHVWRVTTQGLSLPLAFVSSSPSQSFPLEPLPVLAESITSLLLSTLIQPSAIILSLYYIARLPAYIGTAPFHSLSSDSANRFNKLLLSSDLIAQEGPVVQALYASFKLFVLGAILSNKILDDHVFTMRTWHDVSGIPLKVLNELERLSLDILSHELTLDSAVWNRWVRTLYDHHISMRAPINSKHHSECQSRESYIVVRHMLEGLMSANAHETVLLYSGSAKHPTFLGIQDRINTKYTAEGLQKGKMADGFEMDHDGPLREEYLPKRRSQEAMDPLEPFRLYQNTPHCRDTSLYPHPEYGTHRYLSQLPVEPKGLSTPTRSLICDVPDQASRSLFFSGFTSSFDPLEHSAHQSGVAMTLCEYFLSYSRVRIY